MKYLITVIAIMFGSMAAAMNVEFVEGDVLTGTVIVTGIDNGDASVFIPGNGDFGYCPYGLS